MVRWRTAAAALAVVWAFGATAPADPSDAISLEAASEDVVVAPDGSYTQTTHTEIKATNEAGAMQASRINVFYDSEMQGVEILEAHTLKKDGTKIPVDLGTIYEQLPPDNALAVTSFRTKVLLFPQFAAGDTAVYTVHFKTTKAAFAGEYTYGKYFPRGMALKDVRVTVTAPKAMKLRTETHDVVFTKADQGDTIVYSWRMTAPKTKAPPQAAVNPLDREPRFYISSFKDYAALGAAYAAQAEPKAAATAKIKALADQITAGTANRREQTRAIYEWVVKHIRYVAIELGRGSFVPHEADTIVAKGYGDCKDHDTVLQALLKAKGIAAQSMLINAENAYTLSEAPTFSQLNHVITYVPEFDLWLDATAMAPFGVLPFAEYGKPAVRATSKGAGLVTLPMPKAGTATLHQTTTQKIAADGVLSGTTTTTATGPFAIGLRYIGYAVQSVGAEKAAELQLKARGFKDGTGRLIADPLNELGDRYTIRGEFSAKGWESALKEGTAMPGGLRVMSLTGDDIMGPFAVDEKVADEPTTCFGAKADEDVSLELPAGYSFRNAPDDVHITTPNLSFSTHWTLTGNTLTVHREFTSTIGEPVCSGAVRKQTADALKRIARTYDENLQIVRSVADYSKALSEKKDADTLIDRGIAYENAGEHAKAIADFDAALVLKPNNAWALVNRAFSYDNMDNHDRAVEDYTKVIALDPENATAWGNRGIIYLNQHKPELAISDFDKALALDPDNELIIFRRGEALRMTHQYAKVIDALTTLIAKHPEQAESYAARADTYQILKDYEHALADCNKAISLEPTTAAFYLLRAQVRHALGDHVGGNQDSSKAVKLEPKLQQGLSAPIISAPPMSRDKAPAYLPAIGQGMVQIKQHQYTEAALSFERAIKQGAPDASVLPVLCLALAHSARLDDAAYQCSRALNLKDGDGELLESRGYAYFRQGKYREALADFDLASRTYSRDARYLYERGVTKKKLGDASGDADIRKAKEMDAGVAQQVPVKIAL